MTPNSSPPSLATIFLAFLRLGCTAFGGPAMIPYIRRMAVKDRGWLTGQDFELGMGASQIIPGATAMQVAAWVGVRSRGTLGGLAAYLGFGLPAFALMLFLSALYFHSRDLPLVMAVLSGLRVVVCALIISAALDFGMRYLRSPLKAALALLAAIGFAMQGNPILILVGLCLAAALLFQDQSEAVSTPTNGKGWKDAGKRVIIVAGVMITGLALLYFIAPGHFGLALMMAKIDCFAFGGGYVSLPIMLHEVTGRGIMTEPMLMEGVALGQVTPGPIVMTAAFVGYAMYGISGALAATIYVFAPSFLFVVLVEPVAGRVIQNPIARRMLDGSLVALVGLLGAIGLRFTMSIQWGLWESAIGLGALVALRLKADILWVVLTGALLSAIIL